MSTAAKKEASLTKLAKSDAGSYEMLYNSAEEHDNGDESEDNIDFIDLLCAKSCDVEKQFCNDANTGRLVNLIDWPIELKERGRWLKRKLSKEAERRKTYFNFPISHAAANSRSKAQLEYMIEQEQENQYILRDVFFVLGIPYDPARMYIEIRAEKMKFTPPTSWIVLHWNTKSLAKSKKK